MALNHSCSDIETNISVGPCMPAEVRPITLSTNQLIETMAAGRLFCDGVVIHSIDHLKEVYQKRKKEQKNNPYDLMVKETRRRQKQT